jgi:Domain of unknown function (DUF4126)
MPWGVIAGSGWASGLNVYMTVLLLGLAGRFGWAETPVPMQSTTVLAVAGGLYAVEFFADKIPYLDNIWDSIHTIVRPLGAAWMAGLMAGDTTWTTKPVAALSAAALALTSHGAKATTRAAVNVTPEPFSNIFLSIAEDGFVVAMTALALSQPKIAGITAVVLGVLCIIVVWKLARFVKRILRPRRARHELAR